MLDPCAKLVKQEFGTAMLLDTACVPDAGLHFIIQGARELLKKPCDVNARVLIIVPYFLTGLMNS